MTDSAVRDNPAKSRYELDVGGNTAFATYRMEGGNVHILHVETPEALRGQGAAGNLMEGITGIVRGKNLKIVPVCPYAVAWLRRHKEHQDLVA